MSSVHYITDMLSVVGFRLSNRDEYQKEVCIEKQSKIIFHVLLHHSAVDFSYLKVLIIFSVTAAFIVVRLYMT